MKLFVVMLYIAGGTIPQRISFAEEENAFEVLRETANCWYLEDPTHGLPERYRKENEYNLQNNQYGIYMFGRDRFQLSMEWNKAVCV